MISLRNSILRVFSVALFLSPTIPSQALPFCRMLFSRPVVEPIEQELRNTRDALVDRIPFEQQQQWLADGMFQEAAWGLHRRGEHELAVEVENLAIRIVRETNPIRISRMQRSSSDIYELRFPLRLRAVYKPQLAPLYQLGTNTRWSPSLYAEEDAYLFDQVLQLHLVPITITRPIPGIRSHNNMGGSLQLLVRQGLNLWTNHWMGSPVSGNVLEAFDSLIWNTDRHSGNVLYSMDQQVAIDNAYAFRDDFVVPSGSLNGYTQEPLTPEQIQNSAELNGFYRRLTDHLTPARIERILRGRHPDRVIGQVIDRRRRLLSSLGNND